MNMVLEAKTPNAVSSSPDSTVAAQPISFSQCCQKKGLTLKSVKSASGHSWNSVLSKLQAAAKRLPTSKIVPEVVDQPATHSKTFERRAYPRHASDAIVLALNKDDHRSVAADSHPGQKGYAINVSQNGISFASRSAFQLRDELELKIEDTSLNFALNVSAAVVRSTALDNEFWRIDCKLQCPLSNEQVAHLKEYAPSCYVG